MMFELKLWIKWKNIAFENVNKMLNVDMKIVDKLGKLRVFEKCIITKSGGFKNVVEI